MSRLDIKVTTPSITEAGSATGQLAYWDDTAGEWKHTETTELFWDDTSKRLGVRTATPDGVLDVTPDTIRTDSYAYPLPRVTTVQRAALAGMASGALVFDTDLAAVYYYNGAAWAAVGGSAAAKGFAMLTMSADQSTPAHGSTIKFDTLYNGNLTHSAVNYSVILKAGKTYKMEAYPSANWSGIGVNYAQIGFYDLTNSAYISPPGHLPGITSTSVYTFSPPVATYTVGGADIEVCVKKVTDGGNLDKWWATAVWGSKAVFQEV